MAILQVALELLAVLEFLPQFVGEEGEAAAAQLLGRIEREVGMDDAGRSALSASTG